MQRFPKPSFERLVANFNTQRESVHACPFLYRKENLSPTINTCALRMAEALVIANGLVESREAITALNSRPGNGRAYLLGKYGYKAYLCPHGIARGARDLSDFLRQQWGSPSHTWSAQADAISVPDDAQGLTGVMAFIKLPRYSGQGHIDLWNLTSPIGHAYWNAAKIYLWRLD
jgi:hypothetical protein